MNENLNLTKILEGCEGIELWSPVCGYCILDKIMKEESYPIIIKSKKEGISECFTEEGTILKDLIDAECLLFPSKDQRDWSKFIRPIKEDTPVMCARIDHEWKFGYYRGYDSVCTRKSDATGASMIFYGNLKYIIPFDKFNPNDIEGSLKYNIQK